MDNPELVTQIIESGLSIEMVGRWARGATERGLQLKQLIESMDIVSEDVESKKHIIANLDSAVALLKWFAETGFVEPILSKIMELGIDELNKISSALGVINLRRIMDSWDREKKNSSEEYWQNQLTSNPWVISQVFSDPVVILAHKAYVGGKAVDNTGGNIVDFLYKNQITTHVKLVEIKTPTTRLLSSVYRNVFSISTDLTGSINQVLNYREEIEKNFHALSSASACKYEVINPRCLLIAGSFENEQLNDTQKKSFEIFRSELKNVEIITFDELFAKIQLLLGLLEQ
ncbi:MAG: DUF4263 domain-containing protein [Nitrospirota bacterium]|nr:DUF4263 domain-containing protein [Nitrospirota bacterium]